MNEEEYSNATALEKILYDSTGMLAINHPSIATAMRKYSQQVKNNDCIADVISCFLKDTKEANNKEYSTVTIQMKGNELQVHGHKAIPYGISWGEWMVEESSTLNNL